MAYEERLAARIRTALRRRRGVTERKMFGGLAFLLNGKMFCGIIGDELMARVGPDAHEAALERAHVRPMDFTGRPMKGYVFVAAPGLKSAPALARWLKQCLDFVSRLAAKPARRPAPAGPRQRMGSAGSKRVSELREAVALALAGDWQRAHEVAQRLEADPRACWLHAVVHRIEGDVANARYWYRRCRRELRANVSTDDELREIAAALESA